ncbi:MAG: hypothetical protein FWF15_00695 [Oscillospiraceae bacterium]|nr:hypothetical protein [Oscillospiraceae bacterium]
MAKKKFNLFNVFFNPNKDGKGVKKEDIGPRNLLNFFKLYSRNMGRLMSINLLIVFGNFPVIFALLGISGYLNRYGIAPASQLFGPLQGVLINGGDSPAMAALYGVHGAQTQISIETTATYIMYALSALTIFTFGLVSVGTTYLARNIVKGEPLFVWQDFWYAIKKNLRQGLIFGVIDVILMFLMGYNIFFYYFNLGSFINNMLFYFSLIMAILYIMMRFYIYIIMITFNLSIFKVIKNSLIFAIIGFKRNFMAIVGISFLIFINYSLLLLYFPIGVIIPFVFLFGHGTFMAAYAAYQKIEDVMITPYIHEEKKPEIEPIFKDMG